MRNHKTKTLSLQKADTLALIFVNACGPLPKSLYSNSYFGQIINSLTRRVWLILAKSREELIAKFKAWKVQVEKDTRHSIISVRVNNTTEFKSLLT